MAGVRRHEFTGPMALSAMQEPAVRVFPASGYRHAGDLAWSSCLALDRADEHPTAIWTHKGRTAAWGWLELPDGIMLQVDPGHPDLAGQVLDWAEELAPGALSVDIADTEPHLAVALERRGYRQRADAPFMSLMGRPLTGPPDVPSLPDG